MGPYSGLSIQSQSRAYAISGTTDGRNTAIRAARENLRWRISSSARPSASPTRSGTDTTPMKVEFRTAIQNSGSCQRVRKFARPAKRGGDSAS